MNEEFGKSNRSSPKIKNKNNDRAYVIRFLGGLNF